MRALNTRQATPGDAVCLGRPREDGAASFSVSRLDGKNLEAGEMWTVNLCPHFQVNFLFSWTFLPYSSLLPSPFLPSLPSFPLFLFCCVLTLYQALTRHYSSWLHSKKNMILILQMRTLRLRGVEGSNYIIICRTWIWIRSDLTTQAFIHSINRSKFVY